MGRLLRSLRPRHAALIAIVLLGAWLRFTGLAFGTPAILHPDEHGAVRAVSDCLMGAPGSSRYLHPPFYLRTSCQFDHLVLQRNRVFGPGTRHELAALRLVSALAGTATIAFVYLLALRLMSTPAALGAAFLFAVFPVAVVQSKYGTPDAFLTMFVAAALWLQVRLLHHPTTAGVAAAAAATTLAFAAKYNAGFLAFSFLAAHILAARRAGRRILEPRAIAAASAAVAAVFVLTFWGAIRKGALANVAGGMMAEGSHLATQGHLGFRIGAADGMFVFHFVHSILPASGTLLLAMMLAGLLLLVTSRRAEAVVLLCFTLPCYATIEWIYKVPPSFERYALPLVVVYAVAAALAIDRFVSLVPARSSEQSPAPRPSHGWARPLLVALLVGVAGHASLDRSVRVAVAAAGQDTRHTMREWIRVNTFDGEAFFMQWPGFPFYYPRPVGKRHHIQLAEDFLDEPPPSDAGALVLASSLIYERYLLFPDQKPRWTAFYQRLFSEAELLHEVDAGAGGYMFNNPVLRLYRVGGTGDAAP